MATYALDPEPTKLTGDLIAGDTAERQRDRILVGKLAESGKSRRLWLDVSGEQVVAVLGKRGTGKSYTLGVLIEGLAAGQGESQLAKLTTPRAGLVLDIMDIFWTSKIPLEPNGPPEVRRQHDLMHAAGYQPQALAIDIWIPAGYQRPEIDPPNVNALTIRPSDLEIDDWGGLFGVDIYTEPRGMLIADAINHVSVVGYMRTDGVSIAADSHYSMADLLACLENDADLQVNYRPDTVRSVRQRMMSYAALPLFAGPGTPLRDVLRSFRVSVLMLARAPDALKRVIVAVLVRRLLRERRDASFAPKRLDLDGTLSEMETVQLRQFVMESVPRSWVLMDEAHVLAGAEEDSVARDALVKLAKEGRNYGLSLAIATQQPSAVDAKLTSQVETLIVHQLTSPRDASVATQNIRSPLPSRIRVDGAECDVETLLRRLGQGVAAFSSGNAPNLARVCVTAIRPRITAHGGYEA